MHQISCHTLPVDIMASLQTLKNSIWTNNGEIAGDGVDNDQNSYIDDIHGWNFVDNNGNVFTSSNDDVHGTHLAGIIAAQRGNRVGVAGIAPNVKIVPLKFIDSTGNGTLSNAILAIDYAKKIGCQVINASWGGYYYTQSVDPAFYETELQPLADAIASSNALFVTSAGNDGVNLDELPAQGMQCFPAGFKLPNLISVGSSDSQGYLCNSAMDSWDSNQGPATVDIAAPGSNIVSTFTLDPSLGAAIEGTLGNYRTACWGFGLESVDGKAQRSDLVQRELSYLYQQEKLKHGEKAPSILLVTDDNNGAGYPDCSSYWKEALESLKLPYQVYNVPASTGDPVNGPAVADMVYSDIVIWETGRDMAINPSLTPSDTANLTSYLENGGNLLLTGENAIKGNEDWAAQELQTIFLAEGYPLYDLTGEKDTTYDGYSCILDGSDFGAPPLMHDLYAPANPDTSRSGLTFQYAYLSGSSMSASFVAGVAALLYGQNPSLQPDAVKGIIMASAKQLPDLQGKVASGGIVDAVAAIAACERREK